MFDAVTDMRDWELALAALGQRFDRNSFRATNQGVLLIERLGKLYLRTYSHPRNTPTPSPPGGPPALVSGHLRRTWRTHLARAGVKPFTAEAATGPTAVYSRIQELGGTITQTRIRTVRRRPGSDPGAFAKVTHTVTIRLPKRPYVKPMTLAARRQVRRIYIVAWTDAIRGA